MLDLDNRLSVSETLALDPEYNAPLLNVIGRDCHEDVKVNGRSVRILDIESGTHMFSASGPDELEALMDDTDDRLDSFMVNNSLFRKQIQKKFPKALICEYACYVAFKKDCRPYRNEYGEFEFTALSPNWLDYILDHYKNPEFGNSRYILHRILNGPGLGMVCKGSRAAFVLQHKDGESGPLVVDSRYRAQGLGSMLLCRFNNMLFEKNEILYGFVKLNNTASAHMMVKCGYKRTSNNVLWVHRMKKGCLYLP